MIIKSWNTGPNIFEDSKDKQDTNVPWLHRCQAEDAFSSCLLAERAIMKCRL